MDEITQMIINLPDDLPHSEYFHIINQMGEGGLDQVAELMRRRLRTINPTQQPDLFKRIRERRDIAIVARRKKFLEKRKKTKDKQGGYEKRPKRYDDEYEDEMPPDNLFGTGLSKSVIMKGKRIYIT